jgi:hypothetical protein
VWYFVSNKHYLIEQKRGKNKYVVAMDETAIYDYSSVRICLNANIPIATFLFINRWCKAKKPSLMMGRGIPIHKHTTTVDCSFVHGYNVSCVLDFKGV